MLQIHQFQINVVCNDVKNQPLENFQKDIAKKAAVLRKRMNDKASSIIKHITDSIIKDDVIKDTIDGIITNIVQ